MPRKSKRGRAPTIEFSSKKSKRVQSDIHMRDGAATRPDTEHSEEAHQTSSPLMAASSDLKGNYDVFLSFRGMDVRKSFLSHFYAALAQKGIYSYLDSEELRKGDCIKPVLMKAIEESCIAIIIFSEDYASSPWCLEEVEKIMECKEQRGLMVFPVFYKVDPREVRTPRKSYRKAMVKHERKFGRDSEKVKRWKKALLDAGSLSGWDLKDKDEADLINRIVREISMQLDRKPLHVAKHPVGIHRQVVKLESMLNLESCDDVVMIGLWGQVGIGKTTLAKALYNDIFRGFEGSCFLANVRETSKDYEDLVHLQAKLLSEILVRKELTVFSVDGGIKLMQHRLCRKRVLLVLDDVNDVNQLNALAGGREWFGKGSRIIITTRDNHLLTVHGIDEDHVYEVKTLDDLEALELFGKHAFLGSKEIVIRRDLVDSALHYANGLPLALVVLGSYLCGRREREWESALNKLAKSPDKTINDVLKLSYDGLEDYAKEIFLDIACFFKGRSIEYIVNVLNSCDFDTLIGVQVLVEKSLITKERKTIQMHDLIQLMGMDIVKQECLDDPGRRSRLWLCEDVSDVLSGDLGTDTVKAVVLDLPKTEAIFIGPDAFTNMRRLRLLIMINVHNSFQGPIYLPNNLRWFQWPECPFSVLKFPPGPEKLVRLDLCKSNIQVVVDQFKDFKNLKFVNFSECSSLVCMPNLDLTPNLEELDLHGCKNLERAHESVAYHAKLRLLNLKGCSNLYHLLDVLQSKNLQVLNLTHCSKLQRFPDIPDKIKGLEELYLGGTSIEELPASIENLVSLEEMDLMNCKKLAILPSSIYRLQNIKRLRLAGCSKLIKFPKEEEENSSAPHMKTGFLKLQYLDLSGCNLSEVEFLEFLENYSCFPFLRFLSLSRNNFTELPTCGQLDNLCWLDVSYCQQLQEILQIPRQLCDLRATACQSLTKIPSNICHVDNIDLSSCHGLIRHGFTMDDLFKLEWRLKHDDIETSTEEDSSSETKDLLDSQTSTEEDSSSILVNKGLDMADFTVEEHRYSQISLDYQNVFPGGVMPKEFVLVEGSTISFKASQDLYDKFLELSLCVVFGVEDRKNKVSFQIVPHVDGQRRNVLSGTLGSFDSDHTWIQYLKPNVMWGVLEGGVDFGQFDMSYLRFSLSIRVLGGIVKKVGYVLKCKPLEDDLKNVLIKDRLVDPASLCEESDESLDSEAISFQSVSQIPSNICDVDTVDSSSCGFAGNDLFKLEEFHPKTGGQVLLPGGEMPKWLLPNEEGCLSFMTSKDLYKKVLLLVFCVVFRTKDEKTGDKFELLACVNGKTTYRHYRTFSSLDLDHVWLGYHKPEALWQGDNFGPDDWGRFQFSIRASGGIIVKKCGFRLICKPLKNNLEALPQNGRLLDSALLYEVWHGDSQISTEANSSSELDSALLYEVWHGDSQISTEANSSSELTDKGLNMADFSLQEVWVKDEEKEPVVLIGNSYRKNPHVAIKYLVGIDKQVEHMMDLLDLEVTDVRIVGICGTGGVGKTTLAKVIYEQISSRFDSCSFLADIAATTKQRGGVWSLQSKLMSKILKQEYEVDHVAKGVNFFKEVLRNTKVLIVLDDVEEQSHLHEIVGGKLDWFGYGSRIIVTTSIPSILPKFISRGLAHVYEINMMNNDQALELFRKLAQRRNLPIPGFEEAAKDIISSVNGIPLLIEVIGSHLDGKLVEKLIAREKPILQFGLGILEILMVSYEELSEVQREIFLDIACLPADVDCRIATFMWHNPHFPPSDGADALHVKSLVKIGRNNELGMHRLLREFGQQIIRTEDHLDPGRRGRLCNLELGWNTGKMEGTEHLNFVAEDFKSMPNIRFLILDRANVDGDFANIFPSLKWLQWQGCARDFKATNFHVKKLVILDLSWSKVTEDWGGWREIKMPQLKVLNLTGCADLLISPDLSSFTALEILILERCSQLMKLDPSIRHLKYLASLNLRFCNELSMLPIELSHLTALKELLIDGTSVQEIPVSMGYMEQLEIFSASNCLQLSQLPDSLCDLTALSVLLLENAKITRIPDSAEKLVKLRDLSLKNCRWIERLPDSIGNLERLEQLDISGTGISKLPDSITCLRRLKVLKMDSCFVRELPRDIGNLADLEELHASYCRSLKGAIPKAIKSLDHLRILRLGHSSISGLPSEIVSLSCLQMLDLLRCNKIQALPELPSSLTCLRVSSERMKALPDLKFMVKLEEICLGDTDPKELVCASTWKKPRSRLRDTLVVPRLPKLKILELSHSKISKLSFRQGSLSCTHLKKLVLSGVNLQEVSELPISLSVLSIQRCFSLERLPAVGNLRTLSEINLIQSAVGEINGLGGLIALEVLNIAYCDIRNLNGLGQLRSLRRLILSDCYSLDKLPDISELKMLNVLEVQRCEIHAIEGLRELNSLEVLHISECEAEKTQQVQDALKHVMA